MDKRAKIAAGAGAGLLVVGGLAGGLTEAFAGDTPSATAAGRNVSSSCYLDEQPEARIGPCSPAPAWLHNNPEALDKDNQPLPFSFKSDQWIPIIATTSGADSQGKFCPATGAANADDDKDKIYYAGCEPFSLTWANTANPAQRLMPDGTIQNLPAMDPESASESDKVSRSNLQKSTLYNSWKKANPKEADMIDAYWNCADRCAPPAGIRTAYGKAYLAQGEAYHYARGDHS